MGTLVVGVEPGTSPSVLQAVASLATDLSAKVVVVFANSGRYVTQTLPEQDVLATAGQPFPSDLAAEVTAALPGVEHELHCIAGDPAKVLAQVAEEVDAQMIVIGTRRPGIRSKLAQFIDGSIAVALAHRQERPVLVVPQSPASENALPWE